MNRSKEFRFHSTFIVYNMGQKYCVNNNSQTSEPVMYMGSYN